MIKLQVRRKYLMLYENLTFLKKNDRPFFYTNFVSTIDGKVQVNGKNQSAYWPIGSETDFQTLLDLRAYSDLFIHGKNTALGFNHLGRIQSLEFKERRKKLGKKENLQYIVITNTPDDSLLEFLKDARGEKAYIVTTEEANISEALKQQVKLLRIGKGQVDLKKLSDWMFKEDFKNVLVEGGPTLLGSFMAEDLIDEVFLTIAPKIFGNIGHQTLSLIEGVLFAPDKIKKWELLSVKQVVNELFLRYRLS